MALVEVTTFTLVAGSDDETFVRLDGAFQRYGYVHDPGLRRRTVARADDGHYCVIALYDDAATPRDLAAWSRLEGPPAAFGAMVDLTSVRTHRYHTLD